jgi:misacylated tRNA(Ala) deacylase
MGNEANVANKTKKSDKSNNPLYLDNCYMKEFEAEVTSAANKDENSQFIALNRTAFYPNSGGQPHDTGIMERLSDGAAFRVVFVGKFSGEISHEVENQQGEGAKLKLKQGDKMKCVLDWDRRFTFMRYHTADHVLTRVIINHTGAKITGNQISLDKSRTDFDLEDFDREAFQQYVDEANGIMAKGLPVRKYFMPLEEAMKKQNLFQLRDRLPPNVKELRIVQIGEGPAFDTSACGGCHLDNTGEAGKIEIIKMQNKGKSNRRIYFKLDD